MLKARMINFVRNRLAAQARRRDEPDAAIERAMEALHLDALTIGFARRFATYKRAGLILQDVERLAEMVNSSDRPIQIVFGGKAHPEDRMGKELIQHIAKLTRQDSFAPGIVFVEDYDMNLARMLVQGVDVWLNNPRRPQEASGTSGQKAALNGALNFSILDGWWAEAYDGTNGFAIGTGQIHANPSVQDERDHRALIETLTQQVVPLYYRRDASGLPRGWIARQKDAFRTLAWRFNADRMVMDYVLNGYLPAAGGVSCCDAPSLTRLSVVRGPLSSSPPATGCSLMADLRLAGEGHPAIDEGRPIPRRRTTDNRQRTTTMSQMQALIGETLGYRTRKSSRSWVPAPWAWCTGGPTRSGAGRPPSRSSAARSPRGSKVQKRFEREAEILQQFRHPGIVRFLG